MSIILCERGYQLGKDRKIINGVLSTTRKTLRTIHRPLKATLKTSKKIGKTIHHNVVGIPHQRLTNRLKWYKKWHEWRYHSHIHVSILVPYIFIVFAIILFSYNKLTLAVDVPTVWDFSKTADFQFDKDTIEIVGSSAQLKVPLSSTKQYISLINPSMTMGINSYVSFAADETPNGGSITYRLSDNKGVGWKYWDGSNWVLSSSLDQANAAGEIDSNIASFPVTFDGIEWQAIFSGDGTQQVTLNSITIVTTIDVNGPETNADNIVGQKVNGGADILPGDWTNGASPYFSWDAGSDSESGILGYCLYLGQDSTADPITDKGLFGNSLIDTGGHCQFATNDTSIDLSAAGILESPLMTSTDSYYLYVAAIDKAGNIYQIQDSYPVSGSFSFYFDNTPPINPGYISAPYEFISSRTATITWPTSGTQAASDEGSGVVGLQYQIGNTGWYGDIHNNQGDITDLLADDGSYATIPHPDFYNLSDGINMIYFRTWDQAGNISVSYISAAIKINTSGAPSTPQSLVADPTENSENNFSFSWNAPATFIGEASNLSYCYTVNTLPSDSTCNYTEPGVTSLPEGPYATQPGNNTLYVSAQDESGNINFDNYASIIFTADTSAPGMATNIAISDISVQSTSNWRLALSWDVPTINEEDGNGIVGRYRIYRSTNGDSFSLAGTSTSTTYIDSGLSQQAYYYYVTACDNSNNCGAESTVVSMLPTGKFTSPANLTSQPVVSNITTKHARIGWTTDRVSDSNVLIGTVSGRYDKSSVSNTEQAIVHQIYLGNLAAGTTYYCKATWTDIDHNTGKSQEFTFTTKPAPVIKEVKINNVSLDSADINFTSVNASKVSMYYDENSSYLHGLKSINTSTNETTYTIDITDLKDNTKYYYQLSAYDSEGSKYDGNIFSFTTPPRPRISNLRFQPIAGQPTSTQSVTWITNVPASSTVTYGKVGTSGADIQVSKLVTDHVIVVSGLADDSDYFLIAQSRDSAGNLAVSDKQVFKTALDTRPPAISGLSIESTIVGTGVEARGQVIISWKTDELSTSQVGYAEGSTATTFANKTSEDPKLTTEHIVVLSDLPTSKVYSIQAMSYDKARNVGTSDSQPVIVSRPNESVLTIILSALQRVFGL